MLGKGSKRRTVPVGTEATETLATWLVVCAQPARPDVTPEDAYVLFLSPYGKRLTQRQI